MKRFCALAACFLSLAAASVAHAQQGGIPYSDQLSQPPELNPPSRGSVAGQYASTAFGPGDLARGTFDLPLPINLPEERGKIGASPIPSYAADGALSEWGAGWATRELSIFRSRILGNIDYATDERTGPWGRMLKGSDGAWYPDGMKSAVRVVESGNDLIAYLPDGAVWTFDGTQGVDTSAGTYSWSLVSVATATNRTTTYAYAKNTSGRPFLTTIAYGGSEPTVPQYEITFDYATLAVPLVDYRAGQAVTLDRRISMVHAKALDGGQFTERHIWSVGYLQDPSSPTFYLQTLTQAFAASGQTAPTVTYTYELATSYFAVAKAALVPQLAPVVAQYGAEVVQPNFSSQIDIDLDGRTDLEVQKDFTLWQQGNSGYVAVPLAVATSANPICRPGASIYNAPRALARMVQGSDDVQVVALQGGSTGATSLILCDRPGNTLWQTSVPGGWTLGANTRLADLNGDHAPDLIRVYAGGYQAIPNNSTTGSFALGPPVTGTLQAGGQSVAINTTWIHDLNGDGIPDLLSRYSGGVVAWLGEGHLKFAQNGALMPILLSNGAALSGLTAYQFVFFDANNDGITDLLLTNGSTVLVFANSGTSFKQVSVPAFGGSTFSNVKPVVLDAAGNGNTEITYLQGNAAYALDLDAPGVGLLTSADDGRGTVLTFGYQRAPAEVGVRNRNSLLSSMQIASTGYDTITYDYSFGGPALHSVGLFLLGYDRVGRQGALDSAMVTFSNTDDAPGMVLSSVDQDALEPSVQKVSYKTYANALVNGVTWRQLQAESRGWISSAGGADAQAPTTILETTQYAAYANTVCPSKVIETSSAGTLTTTKTFYSLPAFSNAFTCLEEHVTTVGTHPDATLNFQHEGNIARNAVGLITNLTMFEPATGNGTGTPLDVQDVTYQPDWDIATISAPGKGTSSYVFEIGSDLLTSTTAPDGVVTAVTKREPLFDGTLELTINRGALLYKRDFTFDGQERLYTSWNNLGGATAAMPDETDTYRYASGTTPALTTVKTLASLSLPSDGGGAPVPTYAETANVAAADGRALALAKLIPQGWTFGQMTARSRATRTDTDFVAPTVADVTTLTVSALYSGGAPIASKQSSLFDFAATQSTTYNAGVIRDVAGILGIDASGLERTDVENGSLETRSTLDAKSHLVGYTDQAGTRTGYAYDAIGRLRRVVLPDGTHHSIDYDDYARVSRVARDGVVTIQYAYEPATSLLSERDMVAPAGTATAGTIWQRTEYQYDPVGRIALQTDVDSATGASQTFQYYYDGATGAEPQSKDALGFLTEVVGPRYSRAMTYRADGVESSRVVAVDGWRTATNTTVFDEDGTPRQHTRTIADGSGNVLANDVSTVTRDAYGRVVGEQRDGAPFVNYGYDANGLPLTATFSGPYSHGEVASIGYDVTTRMRVGLSQKNATWASSDSIQMNTRGLVGSEAITVSALSTTRSYQYSPQGFLSQSSDSTGAYAYAYAADGEPSQIVSAVVGSVTDTRNFVRSGHFLTAGTHKQTFDDVGRVIQRDGVTLVYGSDGEVAGATSSTGEWSYLYDEKGNRVAKLAGGVPVAAYLPDGSYLDAVSLTTPLRFAKQLVAVLRESTGTSPPTRAISLVAVDVRGTVLSDENGTPRLASPFGDRLTHPDLAAAIDYAAKGYDADLGVVRMGARDYDPALSRFLTPDALFLEHPDKCAASARDCNLYIYAHDAPTSFTDPDGHEPVEVAAVGALALAFTAAEATVVYYSQPAEQRAVRSLADTVSTAVRARVDTFKQMAKIGEYSAPTICSDPNASQEGHHTIPVGLMNVMEAHGMLATDTLKDLTPTDGRDGLLVLSRDAHYLIHVALTAYLAAVHPEILDIKGAVRWGFQQEPNWEVYVSTLEESNGNNRVAARAQLLVEFGAFYGAVGIVQAASESLGTTSECPKLNTANAIKAFATDAAKIASSPFGPTPVSP